MTRNRRTARTMLLIGSSLVLGSLAGQAACQSQPRITLHVPAQSLDAALRQIGRRTGREIMYPADAVEGKRVTGLDGVMTGDEAIRQLLRGTGLEAEFRSDIVLIRDRSPSPISADSQAPTDEAPTIVVTGTRIRGTSPIEPVRIVRASDAAAQGQTNLGQLVRSLPLNFNGGQNPGVVGSDQQGSENVNSSSALNLRGLGADATLTLINGHRVAYDAANQGVDISAIPLLAVDRVEIIAAGSSALYGSDAVAGVANVVLRRDYDGLLTAARISTTLQGGDQEDQLGVLAGRRWHAGGFMAALDYSHATVLHADQRPYTRTLDPSATLVPGTQQISGVIAGHQFLGSIAEATLDAQFNRRSLVIALPFQSPGNVLTAGNLSQRRVASYTVSPALEVRVGGGWRVKVGGTVGESTSKVRVQTYFGGQQLARSTVRYEDRLAAVEASAEGPLFALPGGEARLAVGGGLRHLALDGLILARSGGVTRTTLALATSRDVRYAFGETSLPIIAPTTGVRLVSRLEIDAALRYEHYQDKGGLATPKVGLRYDPAPGFSLRASWGRSFKAPTLFQEGQLSRGLLLPATYFRPAAPRSGPVLLRAGGGNSLAPEKASTWTAGFVLGRDADGPTLEANYFHIDYRDRVLAPIVDDTGAFRTSLYANLISLAPTADQVNAIVASLPQALSNQSGAAFDPTTIAAIVDNRLANVARQTARGVDIQGRYATTLPSGDRVALVAALTYLESRQQFVAGQPFIQRAGTIFDPPHWRGRTSVTWATGPLELTGSVSYLGETLDDRFAQPYNVDSYASFDLSARLARLASHGPLAGVELILTVLDITGEQPGLIRTTTAAGTPYDSTNYPATGRSISLGIAKRW